MIYSSDSRYKEYNTPTTLSTLTDKKLITLGLVAQEDRRAVLGALRKVGYTGKVKAQVLPSAEDSGSKSPATSPTSRKPSAVDLLVYTAFSFQKSSAYRLFR